MASQHRPESGQLHHVAKISRMVDVLAQHAGKGVGTAPIAQGM